VNNKLSNVAPYQVDLSVVRAPYFLIMNQRKWQSLSSEQKAAVETAVADTVKWSRVQTVKEEAALASQVGPLVKSSVKLSPEDYLQVKKATQSLHDKVIAQSGEDGKAMLEVVGSLAD
jgi:TRAP-type C4-dicarboxylate transport system substrate-binding protein